MRDSWRRLTGWSWDKLVDRVAVLEKLVELSGGQENKAEEFFRALKENADAV